MIPQRLKLRQRPRRGAIAVLAAILLVVMIGMIAFALDVGYITLVRSQLQVAADSAVLAAAASTNLARADMEGVARQYGADNLAAGRPVQLKSADIEYGNWDTSTRVFTPSASVGNAVRVTARTDQNTSGKTPLFFARIFNRGSVSQQASAVATVNPRDIAFVIDLSGSMNDDTDPDNTQGINSTYAGQGYPTIGSDLVNQVYADFGYNASYPNEPVQWIGQPLGVTSGGDPLTKLSSKTGPLSSSSIPVKYRITSSDSSTVRKQKAYSWAMDVQFPQVMPAAKPTPNSTTNYAYWAKYLDSNYTKIGYRSYVHFMMYYGREMKPDGATYVPLSRFSPVCPRHSESTAGGTFSFPPREQPTHAARRATIAAINLIKSRNQNISDTNQRDWVSIITFDKLNPAPVVLLSLTGDYDTAMQACTNLQATDDSAACTATETGLMTAAAHIKPQNQGGRGRTATDKIVVLLTDGMPNLYSSSASQIGSYITQNPSSNFYSTGSKYPQDAALMQTSMIQGNHWYLYPVGIGLGCDYNFMDRMARTGATANSSGQGPRGSGNPADYEARLTEIFQQIITNPKLHLVQ
jgi:Flp pilus assembly protein TadG